MFCPAVAIFSFIIWLQRLRFIWVYNEAQGSQGQRIQTLRQKLKLQNFVMGLRVMFR
jgi:hypothetical protein